MNKTNTNNKKAVYLQKDTDDKNQKYLSDACLIELIGRQENKKYNLYIQDLLNKEDRIFSIGRISDINDIAIDDRTVADKHAIIIQKSEKFYIKDNDSPNGTYINDRKITDETLLSSQDKIKVGNTILKFLQGDIESLFLDNLREKINIDKLTSAYNKQFFEEEMKKQFSLTKRYSKHLSLILIDIDDFKMINDTHGHPGGDYVLSQLGTIVIERIRNTDIFARVGGEEFAILCPETNLQNSLWLATELCNIIKEYSFNFENKKIPVTLSVGLCEYNESFSSNAEMYAKCDSLLYKAKNSGKNRVCSE